MWDRYIFGIPLELRNGGRVKQKASRNEPFDYVVLLRRAYQPRPILAGRVSGERGRHAGRLGNYRRDRPSLPGGDRDRRSRFSGSNLDKSRFIDKAVA